MGRRGGRGFRGGRGRGRGRGREGGGGGGGGGGRSLRADKHVFDKSNGLFEQYYNDVLPLGTDQEKKEFWDALRRDLPNSFRFTGSKGHALAVQQRLIDHYIPEITKIEYEGAKVPPPEAIPWFPDQLAWQMTTPKSVVRRFPPFKAFQQFLVSETSIGNISRQEIVSMIPPLLLDVQPGMTVLDLCAAPGSKSAQLVEAVHAGEEARLRKVVKSLRREQGREVSPDGDKMQLEMEDSTLMADMDDDGRATGLLIANDVDYRRAHMLIHQMKRLNSPNLIVTNHDATMFPSIKLPNQEMKEGQQRPANRYLKFDRILADVPCSGDGTARKNPNVWKDWTPSNGLGLHTTQVKILVRSLQMLKVGGRVVYSTCSLNPVENEAVVAAAINRCGGLDKVGILDASSMLPGLKNKAGLKNWKIMDKTGRMWTSFKDVEKQASENGIDGLGRLSDDMFPPAKEVPLERCMRVEPHQQDTGAFFITVLEKKTEIKARPEPPRTASLIRQEASAKDETTNPGVPLPSVLAVVNEIETKPADTNHTLDHIDALDSIAPAELPLDENEDPSPVARMNQENKAASGLPHTKRAAEDSLDIDVPLKRSRNGDEIDAAATQMQGEREVHFPPPPAAQPDRELAEVTSNQVKAETAKTPTEAKAKRNQAQFEEPFKYLSPDQKDLQAIYDFYSVDSRFPRDRFMVRNASGEPVRTIYYTSALARDVLTENEGKGIKFVHCGVKMFVKQDVQRDDQCPWRIQTDGLQLLEAWVTEERIVRLTSRKTLHRLLREMFPKVDGGGWQELGEIGERVRDIGLGCCVLRVETGEGEDAFSERMVLPLWRSLHSLNLMLPKEDRRALLLRLYNDNSELIDHQKERQRLALMQPTRTRRATAADDPAPGETYLRDQRAADLEEIAAEYGTPSDDDEADMDEEGGVRLDLDGGVALVPNAAERETELQLKEENQGIREGGVGTADNEDVREGVRSEAMDSGLFVETKESTKPAVIGQEFVSSEVMQE